MSAEKRNLPASIHQRLLNKAHETGQAFNELIQYYAIDRAMEILLKKDQERTNHRDEGDRQSFEGISHSHRADKPAGNFIGQELEGTLAMKAVGSRLQQMVSKCG